MNKKIWTTYLLFLLIGLINAIFAELAIVPEQMITGYPTTIMIHTIFLTIAFLTDRSLISKIKSTFHEYLAFYLVFGFAGLFVIEWLLVGNLVVDPNPVTNLFTQAFMFSFWAGVGLIPKILLDKRFKAPYKKTFTRRIFYLTPIMFIGAAFYFLTTNLDFWLAFVGIFYISLNIPFYVHFRKLGK